MKKDIQRILTRSIREALQELEIPPEATQDICLDIPAESRFGDFSTNIALRLSKVLGKPPKEIAGQVAAKINGRVAKTPLKNYLKEAHPAGAGFINFFLADTYLYSEIEGIARYGSRYLRQDTGRRERVLIEFVSANPTGALSVAHARQAAVGDSLANVLAFLGLKVKREYYLNDEGNQINILGESVALRIKELNGEKTEFPENYYQGEYIYDIARQIRNPKSEIRNLGDYAAEYILNIIKKELDDFGVKFDYWRSQKELRESGRIQKTLDYLKKKGHLYEQEGALWFKSTLFGDDKDRVVIKSDGSYTYLAPDIAYHKEKYERGFTRLINLWGPDHHGYIGRLKASVQAMGHPADSLSVIIVQLATIFREGKPVQMSTRKGQYITLREVLDEVGRDASRFFFLMRRTSSHLDFDLDVAKKHTPENPVYYVQYAHARISSILRAKPASVKMGRGVQLSLLKEEEESALIRKILQFAAILQICRETLDPYMLTVYLQEVAGAFHKFYDKHRVLSQDDKLTAARLCLIAATRAVIACGLELLGVSRPEEM